ncbi:MAG: TatD family hydrolase [Candidatus Omnitrophota bacterium]
MLIDTHCHLDFKDFDPDRDGVIERALSKGVARIVNVASSMDGSIRAVELARKHGFIYASVGIHPHDASSVDDAAVSGIRALAQEDKVVAVGEVGLDYYRNLAPREQQAAAFKKFIKLARELDLPLILHSREAGSEVLDILGSELDGEAKGVMHCFAGDMAFLKRCLDAGLYVSFTCNLTFKNAGGLREVARVVPPERLLLETDAPFLAPQEFRGKRNEPSYLSYLAEEWSRLLGLSPEDIGRITTHNANALFGLGLEEAPEIAYGIRGSLYLNITNGCTNSCDFCVRSYTPFVKGHNLRLEREPTVEEILGAVGDPAKYKEVVFCGYGEPTMRLEAVKAVSVMLKAKNARIRLVTNGHGDLINSRPIAAELAGLVDKVSVSLNADTKEAYMRLCDPKFGDKTYKGVLDFIKGCVGKGIETEVTCLDLPGVDVKRCEEIAKGLGAEFRLRHAGVTG